MNFTDECRYNLMILSPFKNSSLTSRVAFSLGGVSSLLACISAISSSNSRYLLVIFFHLFSSLTNVDVSWSPVVFTERGEALGSTFPSPFIQSLGDHRVKPGAWRLRNPLSRKFIYLILLIHIVFYTKGKCPLT